MYLDVHKVLMKTKMALMIMMVYHAMMTQKVVEVEVLIQDKVQTMTMMMMMMMKTIQEEVQMVMMVMMMMMMMMMMMKTIQEEVQMMMMTTAGVRDKICASSVAATHWGCDGRRRKLPLLPVYPLQPFSSEQGVVVQLLT